MGCTEKESLPQILSIQHFCLHDGPGTRSIVFFKGCPLRCKWCENPESWSKNVELGFKQSLCITCSKCVGVCPEKSMLSPGRWDKDTCTLCFKCVDACPSGALTRFGFEKEVIDIVNELRPEYPLYRNTGGGVTFSGGEVTLFPSYAADLASRLRSEGIHVAIETCGKFHVDWSRGRAKNASNSPIETLLSNIDLILFDIKLFEKSRHKEFCGAENDDIKRNFVALSRLEKEAFGPRLWPRLPLIPGVTDTTENLTAWSQFLSGLNVRAVTIVPYHNFGDPKRGWLNLEEAPSIPLVDERAVERATKIFERNAVECFMPGEEVWERRNEM